MGGIWHYHYAHRFHSLSLVFHRNRWMHRGWTLCAPVGGLGSIGGCASVAHTLGLEA